MQIAKFKTIREAKMRGQSLIETLLGIIVFVPVALFFVDIMVICFANIANDNLAKTAARAAASAVDSNGIGDPLAAYTAARSSADKFAQSALIRKSNSNSFVSGFCWNANGIPMTFSSEWGAELPQVGDLGVITKLELRLPVPFPFVPSSFVFQAKAVEPVVSIPSDGAAGGDGGQGGTKNVYRR